MAMLFITHDLGIVRKLADTVCVMKEGKIVEQGPVERVFTAPEHPYTRALLAAEPKPDPAPINADAPVVVETKDLKVWFPIKRGVMRRVVGHIKAVDGVSIAVRQGETLGIVGEFGSGKTTLGLAILRLVSSDGPIVFLGNTIAGLTFRQMRPFRLHMQIVFQDPYGSLSPRMSVSDIIEEGLWVHHPKLTRAQREERVVQALRDVGLDPETRFRYPHEFSGGQRQRIAVARAIVLEPTFVVLDEPTSALDMLIQAQIVDLLRALQKRRNLTYMFISHDLRVVAALASRLVVMRHGKVVEEGAAAELFARPRATTRARCSPPPSIWRRRPRAWWRSKDAAMTRLARPADAPIADDRADVRDLPAAKCSRRVSAAMSDCALCRGNANAPRPVDVLRSGAGGGGVADRPGPRRGRAAAAVSPRGSSRQRQGRSGRDRRRSCRGERAAGRDCAPRMRRGDRRGAGPAG